MTGFSIPRTNHTSFTVSDLDRSVAFFRDALGFEVRVIGEVATIDQGPNAGRRVSQVVFADRIAEIARG